METDRVDGRAEHRERDIEGVEEDSHDDADNCDPEGPGELVCHDRKDDRRHADCHQAGIGEDVSYGAHHFDCAERPGAVDDEGKADDH